MCSRVACVMIVRESTPIRRRFAGGSITVVIVALLLVGGFFLDGAGWVLGVAMLWRSSRWTRREKLVGSFILPGGLVAAVVLPLKMAKGEICGSKHVGHHIVTSCSGGISGLERLIAGGALVAALVLPIGSAIYLLLRARYHALGESAL